MADIKTLEHPTLKVPYEMLNKKFRVAQKQIDREVSHVHTTSYDIENELTANLIKGSEAAKLLGGMVQKIQVLKRKAEESISEELHVGMVCKRRIEHLKEHGSGNHNAVCQWRRRRTERFMIEYFLRCGYYRSATCLAKSSDLEDLTNIGTDVFLVSRDVEDSLKERETSKCLAWCHDNRSKLRKLRSNMEFNLRVQEFVELVRIDQKMEAVRHARKHFATYEDHQLDEIQRCMALLAFPADTELPAYKQLLDPKRWDKLVEQFRQENYRLYQMAEQSVFTVVLEAGLSALKTPQCYDDNRDARNKSCPVCQDWMNDLAFTLPYAHCSQSRLICAITGLPMNENNQPMVLPNGYVYGEKALLQMANENDGQVICPRTKEVYQYSQAEKVYVM